MKLLKSGTDHQSVDKRNVEVFVDSEVVKTFDNLTTFRWKDCMRWMLDV